MVEFKRCADGTFCFMEINPRFWGSLQLAIDSGCNFPLALCELFYPGSDSPDARVGKLREALKADYTVGQRLRWTLGSLDHLLIRLKAERLHALKEICCTNSLRLWEHSEHTRQETFRLDDPRPFISELISYCGL